MEYISGYQFLPGDPRLVEHIVHELKSQGIFDQFRKECLADVDTKPAYQNLRQRVEGCVSGFLNSQKWKPEMNKNQLREKLRKTIQESGFLEAGVERIVEQVVNPKISTVFMSKVEEVVYKYHGLEKPAKESNNKINGLNQLEICTNLLPNDLEAISPDSVNSIRLTHDNEDDFCSSKVVSENEDASMKDLKIEEDESPPFELLNENTMYYNDNSNDSHLSGISGLTSQDSVGSPKQNLELDIENLNQDSHLSRVSSGSRLSIIVNSDVTNDTNHTNGDTDNATTLLNNTSETEHLPKTPVPEAQDSIDRIADLKMDVDSLSCDSDAKAMVIVTESSNDADEKPPIGNLMNGLSIKSSNENVAENSTQVSTKSSTPPKSEKAKTHDSRKKSTSSHSNKSDKHHHSSHHQKSKYRSDKSSDSKHKSDDKDKEKSHRDSSKKRSKDSPKKSHHGRSDKDRKDRSDNDTSKTSLSKYKSDRSKSSKHDSSRSHSKNTKKNSDDSGSDQNKISEHSNNDNSSRDSKKDKDKYRKKSKSQDDHGSAKNQKSSYRRSTDRDSNDGNGTGPKKHNSSTYSEQRSFKHKESSNETMERNNETTSSECIKSYVSSTPQVNEKSPIEEDKSKQTLDLSDNSQHSNSPLNIRKPKFASNIFEARRLIKVRRKIEKQVQKEKLRLKMAEENAGHLNKESVQNTKEETTNEETVKIPVKSFNDSEDSSMSEEPVFSGFTEDHKVFHDSDDDEIGHKIKVNKLKRSRSPSEENTSKKMSSSLSPDLTNSYEQTPNPKSQAEIMEIIFGCGVTLGNSECSPNTMSRTNGFQVSYCSDYDDDHEEIDESNSKKPARTPKSEKISNCTNNNVVKKKVMSDDNISPSEKKLNDDYDYTPNGLSENKNRSPRVKSNVSPTKSANNETGNPKTKRSSIYNTQCYSNEDLYKPRPSFGSSRRRKVSGSYN